CGPRTAYATDPGSAVVRAAVVPAGVTTGGRGPRGRARRGAAVRRPPSAERAARAGPDRGRPAPGAERWAAREHRGRRPDPPARGRPAGPAPRAPDGPRRAGRRPRRPGSGP